MQRIHTFINTIPTLGVNPCRIVTKTITIKISRKGNVRQSWLNIPPMAIPRSTQGLGLAVWFAATRMLGKCEYKARKKRYRCGMLTYWQRPTSEVKLIISLVNGDWQELTIHPAAVNPNKIAFMANITVARNLGFVYTASRYTFSPPERGIMVPNSSQMKRPQNDSTNPRTQSMREAPTELTEESIDDGVEKIPVPIIRPTLA